MLALIPILFVIIISIKYKNIYSSLLIGIFTALLLFTNFNVLTSVQEFINSISTVLSTNIKILIYIIMLGIYLHLITISEASHYFAKVAVKKLKTKKQTLIVTTLLGIFCYIDDYLNIITVNSIMRPVTDKMKISRAKLAYIVDATASPVSVILGILGGSWTCLVASSLPKTSTLNGFSLYVKTVPYIIYPFLTILFVFLLISLNFDFGKMKKLELKAEKSKAIKIKETKINPKLKLRDLFIPILIVPILTVLTMLYLGGLFGGVSISEAFLNCDAILSAIIGLGASIIIMLLLYIPRRIITIQQALDSVSSGFDKMASTILLLILAWTFATVCGEGYLDFSGWLGNLLITNNVPIILLPVILYILTYFITFCNGCSWTTIALLTPLCVYLFGDAISPIFLLCLGAIIAGSVSADHNGAINDTTLLSAKISECDYEEHVVSQLQYSIPVMICTAIFYLITSFIGYWFALLISVILLVSIVLIIRHKTLKS